MYSHIFFDLDRTLWDFEKNSHEVLNDLFFENQLNHRGISDVNLFITVYKEINEGLWELYRKNKIQKETLRSERFKLSLEKFNIMDNELSVKLGDDYIERCPQKTHLFPFTHSTLTALKNKYTLHIITNGFEEVQHKKLANNNLSKYFNSVVTSEQVGYKKPTKEIFQFSLAQVNAKPSESLMIGDDLKADIGGARSFGIDQVFFNPDGLSHNEESITHEIQCLSQLLEIL
ncbi:MAG: YjjG family noncanonical pyrimidine nucleotidase [Flavobacteriales bacterium]